ncbi:MAG TPA: reverse transcriptase-like protein [Petrotogaceae bacterium]|jgi:ribonuclease HI|nr:reverse transcriptase-like protein [Petrotogaceae bacterium]HNV06596.1 reverse transcriptase-like protein [Petrotogaceae bacterium]HPO28019.1 reverse transcriptase-like protein [Petrotogaceae bacterium]
MLRIYTDGSYKEGKVGYAFVVVNEGKVVHRFSAAFKSFDPSRQVAGEIQAVLDALQWLKKMGEERVQIFYDYSGLEEWACMRWKAKTPNTRKYQQTVADCGIEIFWNKVQSHSGDEFNDMADSLARQAMEKEK